MLKGFVLGVMGCAFAWGQTPDAMQQVLDRLARLEARNQALENEVRELRERLGPLGTAGETAPLAERVEVGEQRVLELNQTRIASENKFPVTLTGMLLFNAYLNGKASNGAQYPTTVPATGRAAGGGATLRQSIIGLKVDGPTVVGGGKVRGSVYMDFFAGGTGLNQTMRLRNAALNVDWKRATAGFAFEKPLVALRDPDSLAQVGVSALTGSGNLWLWVPQARVEYRMERTDRGGVRAQLGMIQTSEGGSGLSADYGDSLAASRPGYEGRFEFWAQRGSRRIEVAPGFHASTTRVIGQDAASRIFAVDWLVRPAERIDFTGTYFSGQNVGVIGGLRQGVSILYPNSRPTARSVRSQGGWAQLKVRATQRTTFHFFAGQQDDRNRDLTSSGITKNQSFGGNVMYRWGPNILTGFEASQVRTSYFGNTRINPHYDLAIAYLF